MSYSKRHRSIFCLISIIVIFSFLWSNVVWAGGMLTAAHRSDKDTLAPSTNLPMLYEDARVDLIVLDLINSLENGDLEAGEAHIFYERELEEKLAAGNKDIRSFCIRDLIRQQGKWVGYIIDVANNEIIRYLSGEGVQDRFFQLLSDIEPLESIERIVYKPHIREKYTITPKIRPFVAACLSKFPAKASTDATIHRETHEEVLAGIEKRILSLYPDEISWVREHARRTAELAGLIAGRMGLGDGLVRLVRKAALAHDLGKGSSPEMIMAINDPHIGKAPIIDTHSDESVKILQSAGIDIDGIEIIIEAIRNHHAPQLAKGQREKLIAEIISVADEIDTSQDGNRPYPKGITDINSLKAEFNKQRHSGRISKPVCEAAVELLSGAKQEFIEIINQARRGGLGLDINTINFGNSLLWQFLNSGTEMEVSMARKAMQRRLEKLNNLDVKGESFEEYIKRQLRELRDKKEIQISDEAIDNVSIFLYGSYLWHAEDDHPDDIDVLVIVPESDIRLRVRFLSSVSDIECIIKGERHFSDIWGRNLRVDCLVKSLFINSGSYFVDGREITQEDKLRVADFAFRKVDSQLLMYSSSVGEVTDKLGLRKLWLRTFSALLYLYIFAASSDDPELKANLDNIIVKYLKYPLDVFYRKFFLGELKKLPWEEEDIESSIEDFIEALEKFREKCWQKVKPKRSTESIGEDEEREGTSSALKAPTTEELKDRINCDFEYIRSVISVIKDNPEVEIPKGLIAQLRKRGLPFKLLVQGLDVNNIPHVRLFVVKNPAIKDLFGIPRFKGALITRDTIPAYSLHDRQGNLCIYVTENFYEYLLKDYGLFGFILDHEYYEKGQTPHRPHERAWEDRGWLRFFRDKRTGERASNGVNKFLRLYIDRLALEGDIEGLDRFEHARAGYRKLVYEYAQSKKAQLLSEKMAFITIKGTGSDTADMWRISNAVHSGGINLEIKFDKFDNDEIYVYVSNPEYVKDKECILSFDRIDSKHETLKLFFSAGLLEDCGAKSITCLIPHTSPAWLVETLRQFAWVKLVEEGSMGDYKAGSESLGELLPKLPKEVKDLGASKKIGIDSVLFMPDTEVFKQKGAAEATTITIDQDGNIVLPKGLKKDKHYLLVYSTDAVYGLLRLFEVLHLLHEQGIQVTLLTPHFSYMRQHKAYKLKKHGPSAITGNSARAILKAISRVSGQIYTVNIHFSKELGKMDVKQEFPDLENLIEIYNVNIFPALVDYFKIRQNLADPVIVGADKGADICCRDAAKRTGVEYGGHMNKERDPSKLVHLQVQMVMPDIDVKGRDVILLDDIIASGTTIINAVLLLKSRGARGVFVGCAYGEFSYGLEVFSDKKMRQKQIEQLKSLGQLNEEQIRALQKCSVLIDAIISTDIMPNPSSAVSAGNVINDVIDMIFAESTLTSLMNYDPRSQSLQLRWGKEINHSKLYHLYKLISDLNADEGAKEHLMMKLLLTIAASTLKIEGYSAMKPLSDMMLLDAIDGENIKSRAFTFRGAADLRRILYRKMYRLIAEIKKQSAQEMRPYIKLFEKRLEVLSAAYHPLTKGDTSELRGQIEGNEEIVRYILGDCNSSKVHPPYVVGIAGGAGVGKTTLASSLENSLRRKGKKVLVISLDEFFKSPEERRELGTEWDEEHVRLKDAESFMNEVKSGNKRISRRKYVRGPVPRMVEEVVDLEGIDIVIFEGLHVINNEDRLGNFLKFVDLPIYMDADVENLEEWRFKQEREKANPRTLEQMERHWKEGVLIDLNKNILPQAANAKLIIYMDKDHNMKLKWQVKDNAVTDRDFSLGKVSVYSLGGNSLLTGKETAGLNPLKDEDFGKIKEIQRNNVRKTLRKLLPNIKNGGVITHGNGPETGVLLEKKLGRKAGQQGDEKYLVDIVEQTQYWIGGDIKAVLIELGIPEEKIEVVITQVAVDPNDEGFKNPTKPIGVRPKDGPDTRPNVASPKPLKIVQIEEIKKALAEGKIVICVGGGGIPVNINNYNERLPAVIDKDFATALLVRELQERGPPMKRVVILTAEPVAFLNYGKPNQTPIYHATVAEMKQYIREGHFAPGKMLPKIQAALDMLETGAAHEVVITSPEYIDRIGEENIGTTIVNSEVLYRITFDESGENIKTNIVNSSDKSVLYNEQYIVDAKDTLVKDYGGPGILSGISEIEIVDEDGPVGSQIDSKARLHIDLFRDKNLVLEILQHEAIHEILGLIIPDNPNLTEVIATWYSAKRFMRLLPDDQEKLIGVLKDPLNGLDPEGKYAEFLEYIRDGKLKDDDLIAPVCAYLGLEGFGAEAVKKADRSFNETLKLFNDLFWATHGEEVTKKVKETESKMLRVIKTFNGVRVIGKKISDRVRSLVGYLARHDKWELPSGVDIMKPRYIVVDKERKNNGLKSVEDELWNKYKIKVVTDKALVPKGADVVVLVDPKDVKKWKGITMSYLPLPYGELSLKLAASMVLSGIKVEKGTPVYNFVRGFYEILLGPLTDEEVLKLFSEPWWILPRIDEELSNDLDVLREAISQLDVAV